jgi:hypothetical protein
VLGRVCAGLGCGLTGKGSSTNTAVFAHEPAVADNADRKLQHKVAEYHEEQHQPPASVYHHHCKWERSQAWSALVPAATSSLEYVTCMLVPSNTNERLAIPILEILIKL